MMRAGRREQTAHSGGQPALSDGRSRRAGSARCGTGSATPSTPVPGSRPQIHRPARRAAAQPADPLLDSGVGAPRRTQRPRGPVHQAGLALSEPAVPPLRHRAPRQPHLAGHLSLGVPAATRWTSDSRPVGVNRALVCDIEPPVSVGVVTTTTLAQEAHPIALLPTSMSRTARLIANGTDSLHRA